MDPPHHYTPYHQVDGIEPHFWNQNVGAGYELPLPPPAGQFHYPNDQFIKMLYAAGPSQIPFGTIPHHEPNHIPSPRRIQGLLAPTQPPPPLQDSNQNYEDFTSQLFGRHPSSPYQPSSWEQEQGFQVKSEEGQVDPTHPDSHIDHSGAGSLPAGDPTAPHWDDNKSDYWTYGVGDEQFETGTSHQQLRPKDEPYDAGYESGEVSPIIHEYEEDYKHELEQHQHPEKKEMSDHGAFNRSLSHAFQTREDIQNRFGELWDLEELEWTKLDPTKLAEQVTRIKMKIPPMIRLIDVINKKIDGADGLYRSRFFDRLTKLDELMSDVKWTRIHKRHENRSDIWQTQSDRENDLKEAMDRLHGVGYVPDDDVIRKMQMKHISNLAYQAARIAERNLENMGFKLLEINRKKLIKILEKFHFRGEDRDIFRGQRASFIKALSLYLEYKRFMSGQLRQDLKVLMNNFKSLDREQSRPVHRLVHHNLQRQGSDDYYSTSHYAGHRQRHH